LDIIIYNEIIHRVQEKVKNKQHKTALTRKRQMQVKQTFSSLTTSQ